MTTVPPTTPPDTIVGMIAAGIVKRDAQRKDELEHDMQQRNAITRSWHEYFYLMCDRLPESVRPFAQFSYSARTQTVEAPREFASDHLLLEIPGLAAIDVFISSSDPELDPLLRYTLPSSWEIGDYGEGEQIYYSFVRNGEHTDDLEVALSLAREYHVTQVEPALIQRAGSQAASHRSQQPANPLTGPHYQLVVEEADAIDCAITNRLRAGWSLYGNPFEFGSGVAQAMVFNVSALRGWPDDIYQRGFDQEQLP